MNPRPDVADHQARILVIDDERHQRRLMEVMLGPEGYLLQTAASGEEALAMVAQQPPDLILLDVMMPGMDGYQVAAQLKGNPATDHIPLIMVTVLDDRTGRMLGLSAGAEDFLSKPVDRAELCVRVRNLLRLKAYGDHYDQYSQLLEAEVVARTADLLARAKTLEQQAAERLVLTERLSLATADQLRFKDEFLSHVSHELRSPLTAIKQFTTILLGGLAGELNKEQNQYQQIVLKNIGQLQSMIDDLLEVTRLETGKLTVEPESVSVASAVTDSFNTLQGAARAKGVSLSYDLPPDLPPAHADPTRLRQILIILLDNAIKFNADGGTATLQAQLLPDDPRFLLLEVSDTGCGISPEMVEKIFERLYQEPNQASRKGLGLGLYICNELVKRQGGRIWVNRQPQQGTTFSFTLPVFSLDSVLAPLLKNGQWPGESTALISVETRWRDAWSSKESQEEWSHEARSLLQRCLLPDLDVLLPAMHSAAEEEHFFVAAFADAKGASVLVNRIRDQFQRLPRLQHSGATLAVSFSMLPPLPRDAGASVETIVTSMATRLEDSINSRVMSEVAS
ncbi:MAG TPA: ATP-binding protein [Gemmatimonadales bacterium]|nr:ATP-binding protein [Gemmatimonadales bacterium]